MDYVKLVLEAPGAKVSTGSLLFGGGRYYFVTICRHFCGASII